MRPLVQHTLPLLLLMLCCLPTRGSPSPCGAEFRTLNGTCTNGQHPEWTSVGQPHFSYTGTRRGQAAGGLPSARHVSNVLCRQYRSLGNAHGLTELFVFFGQFVDHDLVFTPVDQSRSMDIEVPQGDSLFGNVSRLVFHRSRTVAVANGGGERRAVNQVTGVLDLSAVYGVDRARSRVLREWRGGRLLVSAGGMLPLNSRGVNNAPTRAKGFFVAGDHRVNEHAMLVVMHTLFVREHNRLCAELAAAFADWDDGRLFEMARLINGAQFQKVVYEQFVPAMLGEGLRAYSGYRSGVDGGVSDVFSTAAFRVGHTMVGNGIHRVGEDGRELEGVPVRKMFFQPAAAMSRQGIEPFLRGALKHRAQQVDIKVVEGLRNMLFARVEGEEGLDLVALNLQRGRDHGLPSYNDLREEFGMRRVKSFADVTRDRNLQSALANVYGSVDRIEAWVGMVAEDHKQGAGMGRLLVRVWKREFERMREGDRLFYKRPGLIPKDVWRKVPRLWQIYVEKDTMRSIILRNTDLREDEVKVGRVFRNREL
eukprot:GFKZ01011758.1.p2 GENE.GFKZ01011758.1~~GFKZ01011758.1.p2  ORF type:complete len:616 (+),score=44.25 GFKZ01011758.1:241-1848(+)